MIRTMKKMVILAGGLVFSLVISVYCVSKIAQLNDSYRVMSHLEALAAGETDEDYVCSSGGPGAISCEVSFTGGVKDAEMGTSCKVECGEGYYACCNALHNKCQCRKYV